MAKGVCSLIRATCFVFLAGSIPVLMASRALAAAPLGRCQALVEDLQDLRKAQNQIISSLAQNHDVFADQISSLSFELALYKKSVPSKALNAMEKSAQAYRIRAQKGFQTADRLDESTADLIKKIQSCLK